MASVATLGQYYYTYGAGSRPNRRILFQRTEGCGPGTIHAVISARFEGRWEEISRLAGALINVELANTSEKARALEEQSVGHPYSLRPDEKLSKLGDDTQEAILSCLEPEGSWRIGITNGFGEDPRFERVTDLNVYNPS